MLVFISPDECKAFGFATDFVSWNKYFVDFATFVEYSFNVFFDGPVG